MDEEVWGGGGGGATRSQPITHKDTVSASKGQGVMQDVVTVRGRGLVKPTSCVPATSYPEPTSNTPPHSVQTGCI